MSKSSAAPLPAVSYAMDASDSAPAFLRRSLISSDGRGARGRRPPAAETPPQDRRLPSIISSGVPDWALGEALLFDTARAQDAHTLPESETLVLLLVTFASRPPSLNADVEVQIYADDLAAPRARADVLDIVRQGGQRPLNVRREAGQRVRVVLVDPARAWEVGMPAIEVRLMFGWT